MLRLSNCFEEARLRKLIAVVWAFVFHLGLIVLFVFIVVLPEIRDKPELVVATLPPSRTVEVAKVKRSVTKQIEKSAARTGGASAIAKLMRANATAMIAAPKVETVSSAPLGLGEGEFGVGGFGSGPGGMGSGGGGTGGTLFGRAGGNPGELVGRLYDMKQDRGGKSLSYSGSVETFFPPIVAAGAKHFSEASLADFYEASVKLGFTFLAIPYIDANEGPKAFQAEKEIEPRGWFVHYSGMISPPKPGEYRFVGAFDDALFVYINDKLVLDASWHDSTNDPSVRQNFGGPSMISSKPVWAGKWVKLVGGDKIDIVVGERPGGFVGGSLLVENQGTNYETRPDGTPILPVFAAVVLGDEDVKRIQAMSYEFAEETPVFRSSASGRKRGILQF
jgi:hypothetical protein